MKDKEKQIEKTMYEVYAVLREHLYRKESEIVAKPIAEHLINNGWIKPDEDSVVLPREEYEKLHSFDLAFKILAEPNPVLISAEKYEELKQAHKETAEKFKGFIRELLTNGDDSITTYYGDVKYRLIREDDLQELAKQLGVEIKEN